MRALLELQTMRPESRFRITTNQPSIEKMMMASIYRYDVIKTFWRCSVVMLSYWSKFHVNFITGSGVMTTFLVRDLTRNQEFRNIPVWVLTNIRRLRQVRDFKFGMNVSNVKLLYAAEFQIYSFYRF